MLRIKAYAPLAVICAAPFLTIPGYAQDAVKGAMVFKTYCSNCHTVQPNKNMIGPSLFGVVDRPSGRAPDFHYSDANRKSGIIWNVATLDNYLAAPRQVVPGTLMSFPGLKDPRQRADLIAYLATLR
jgi:cytochrome c